MMRAWSVLVLLATSWLAGAHMIEVPAGKKECFFEDLHINDKAGLCLSDPINIALHKRLKESEGTASLTAEKDGRYSYCFSNEMSTVTDKEVSFNVHGVIYVQDDGTVAPIEREVRELAIGLQAVKDEQEYIVIRERVHRNTAESTNDRVKWWSIGQAVVLVAVCGFQVYYLQSFFEVKRVI
ncbi:Supernatant protein factor protein [Rhizoctonia solani]|uniref:Supernatant protein factor protein n=2 Tax=Rhizoctonia solani TaxID=456999 RepID=A0A8H7LIL8_9AGAM